MAIGAIVGTILTLAASLGLDKIVTNIEENRANSKDLTPDLILRDIKVIMSELEKQGPKIQAKINNKLVQLQDQLNSLPYSQGTGNVKRIIQKAINDNKKEQTRLMKMSEEVADQISENNSAINNITNRATTLAYQPSSYRSSQLGTDDLERIKQDAKQLVENNQRILEGVEKHV